MVVFLVFKSVTWIFPTSKRFGNLLIRVLRNLEVFYCTQLLRAFSTLLFPWLRNVSESTRISHRGTLAEKIQAVPIKGRQLECVVRKHKIYILFG